MMGSDLAENSNHVFKQITTNIAYRVIMFVIKNLLSDARTLLKTPRQI